MLVKLISGNVIRFKKWLPYIFYTNRISFKKSYKITSFYLIKGFNLVFKVKVNYPF